MWIFTKYGFFSASAVRQGDGRHDKSIHPKRLLIRANVQNHLEALKERFPDLFGNCEISNLVGAVNSFSMLVQKSAWIQVVSDLAEEIDYENFKSKVAHHQECDGSVYTKSLHRVWSVMNRLQWNRRKRTLVFKAEDKTPLDPLNVLRGDREQMPTWLLTASEFRPEDFFSSRVVYYPGSGTDGQAVELFCGSHSAHSVLHIDQLVGATDIQHNLEPDRPHHIKGYTPFVQQVLAPADVAALLSLTPELCPTGQEPVVRSALWTVLKRQQDFREEHGPERIAFLHVQAEAIWVCRSVWRTLDRNPFAIVIQDHGFGCNWTRFGGATSPLYKFQRRHSLPKWLLVGDNTDPWPTYQAASDPSLPSGTGPHRRTLYKQTMNNPTCEFTQISSEAQRQDMPVPDYESFDLKSPYRSTIPLLAYWCDPKKRLIGFGELIDIELPVEASLTFEYTVVPIMGRGKASHTDLMIVSPGIAIGVEAKYTEPPYEDVNSWLGMPPAENRRIVLEGWLKLISDASGCRLRVEQIQNCTYQLIHRTASVCSVNAEKRAVVYHCFDVTDLQKQYYAKQLQALANLIAQPTKIQFFLVTTTLSKTAPFSQLQDKWDLNESRDFSVEIRNLLSEDNIAEFGDPVVTRFETALLPNEDVILEQDPWVFLWEYANHNPLTASRLLNFMCSEGFQNLRIAKADMQYLNEQFALNEGVRYSWAINSRFVQMNAQRLQINSTALNAFLEDNGFDVVNGRYNPQRGRRDNWINNWAQV